MSLDVLFLLLGILSTGAAVVVWLQQANRRGPGAEDAQPLVWFLVVRCLDVVGILLYWATVDERGPLLRPITDEDLAAWGRGRKPE